MSGIRIFGEVTLDDMRAVQAAVRSVAGPGALVEVTAAGAEVRWPGGASFTCPLVVLA